MLHGAGLGCDFFNRLVGIDEEISRKVAAAGCGRCRGPLHAGHYARKPRGALVAAAGEGFNVRFSLCCGWCRCRTLPPSVRFLGRRVYFGAVVVLATLWALCGALSTLGVPKRTVQRWSGWWSTSFPLSSTWIALRARFVPPPPDEAALPKSLVEMLTELGPLRIDEILVKVAALIAPVTTQSCPDCSRFVRLD